MVGTGIQGKGQRYTGIYFFLGGMSRDDELIEPKENVAMVCAIPKPVAASAAELELYILVVKAKQLYATSLISLNIVKLSHPQMPTPIHVDSTTTAWL